MSVSSKFALPAVLPWSGAFWKAWRTSVLLRLVVATVALGALCFAILSVLIQTTTRDALMVQFEATQQSAANILADSLNQEFEERLRGLELASATLSKFGRFDAAAMQSFLDIRPVLNAMFNGGIFITGRDGVAMASTPANVSRVGVNYADRPFVQAALGGRAVFGDPVIGKQMGRTIITIAVPLYGANGAIFGAMVGVIDPSGSGFLDRISQARFGKGGGYILVAPASRMVVAATDSRLLMKPVPSHPTINRFIAGEDGTGELVNSAGVQVVSSVKHLPVNGWYVGASMPVEEAYAPIAALQRSMLNGAAGVFTLVVLAFAWIARRELAPLGRAARVLAAHRASGLPVRELPVGRRDEIGELIHGFNDLIKGLRERETTIESGRRRLERLLHASPVPAFLCDEGGRFTFVNRAFEAAYGYTLSDISDIHRWRELALADAGTADQAIARWIAPASDGLPGDGSTSGANALPDAGLELKIRCKDGSARTALVKHVTLTDGSQLEQFVAVVDITAQIEVQEALKQTTADKEALLREVHHRVKNNLQVITSLLRLESGRSQVPELLAAFADMQGRIRSMALIHEMLYREGVFASMDLGQYLRQMATQVFRSQAGTAGAVRLETELESVQVSLDQATPCGLLVNELLSNSLKHAFSHGRGGTVRLALRIDALSGLATLSIADDGVGLPADFEQRRKQSLGMQLADDLAHQMRGTLAIAGNPGTQSGSHFEVRFTPVKEGEHV